MVDNLNPENYMASNELSRLGDEVRKKLKSTKSELGDLKRVELRGTIPVMFAEVGKSNSQRIKKTLEYRKSKDTNGFFGEKTQRSLDRIREKVTKLEKTFPRISQTLNLYLTSLEAWAEGAGISLTDALMLQDDTLGCQTVMVRGVNGEVIVGHTEEWYMEEEEKENIKITPEWTTFIDTTDPDVPDKIEAFTGYAFSLPGSSFGLHNGRVVAVDTLIVKNTGKSIPANIAAWVAWKLAGEIEPEEVFRALGPFKNGYAYNNVGLNKDTGMVEAKTIEFAGAQTSTIYLPSYPLGYMVQTNEPETTLVRKVKGKHIDPDEKKYYDGIRRTHVAVRQAWIERLSRQKEKGLPAPEFTPNVFNKEFSLIVANNDYLTIPQVFTYAHMFAVVRADGSIQTQIGSGPVLPGDK